MSSPVFGTEISVLEGTSVTLVCRYLGAKKLDKCWSRASGTFQCTDPIKEEQSKYKVNAGDGTVNLTILNLQPADSGSYCCTVNVPISFNDLIQIYSLRVVKDYLHYFNESKSWINALEFCKSRGSTSNLVHITNQTVQADVTQLLANVELPCGGVWIGLERSIFEWSAPWLWTSSAVEKVVEHRQWHSCFPLNPINYHCGKMVRVGNGELKWLDASCHQELPFICEDYLHYFNESKSWINALEFCKSRGSTSNLVHITNQIVQADVTQLLANVELPWGECGLMVRVGNGELKWLDASCHQELPFIFEGAASDLFFSQQSLDGSFTDTRAVDPCPTSPDRKPTSSPSSTTSPLHPDYLHYFNESKSWINALEFCKSRGSTSNLVHITNQTVQADVTQLLANVELPCGGVWIGLERSIFEWSAPWLWTSSDVEKVVKYREWHSCFPLNPINYHCGKMVRVGNGELKWLDASCHQELPFICEDLH
ncbi:hypothetical protein J4Q44_G00143360 [Coregonus suidteri]|uniref:Secretory phospholipase A2 receptor n=1 Tax=Coregonus suidteri TaxID=861788 RepID=A0AAN8LR33_9TELE